MPYRLPSERITLDLDGPDVEVERLSAWGVEVGVEGLLQRFYDAKTKAEQHSALSELYGVVVYEAQPTWDIVDHHGPVPVSQVGMLRLPLELGLGIAQGWYETSVPKPSAVDEIVPAGPARDELNRRLKARKAA